jgi:DNA-binding transcriptional MerR regulator
MLLKVGELAKHTGLTVRTLHHYDEIGLLKPSGRSESGYRLYSRADVARLHGIQALRHLGLALGDIAAMLEEGGTPPGLIIEQQIRALDREIAQATELRDHLGLLQHQLFKGDEPDMAAWLDTLSLMKTYGKYFSAAELKTIFANWKLIDAEWEPLIKAVRALMDEGFAPDAPEVQPLAQRWMRLMLRWMEGNFDLIDRWGEMYEKEPTAHGRNGAPPSDMIDFIRRAIDLRMALLAKYLSLEEIRRLCYVPDAEWRELAGEVEALMANGVAPSSEAAQPAARQWLALIDRVVGHDPAVRVKLLVAHSREPLLQAGSMLPATVRAFLRESAAKALTLT